MGRLIPKWPDPHNRATTLSIRSCPTWVSIGVVAMLSWPSRAWRSTRSAPASSGWVAVRRQPARKKARQSIRQFARLRGEDTPQTVRIKRVSGTHGPGGKGRAAGPRLGERWGTCRGGEVERGYTVAGRSRPSAPPGSQRAEVPRGSVGGCLQGRAGDEAVDSKTRWENLVILYDRLTPAAQQRLIDRFVILHPERLVKLTTLRAQLAKMKNRRI